MELEQHASGQGWRSVRRFEPDEGCTPSVSHSLGCCVLDALRQVLILSRLDMDLGQSIVVLRSDARSLAGKAGVTSAQVERFGYLTLVDTLDPELVSFTF